MDRKHLLTRRGYERLSAEYRHLRDVQRPAVVQRVAEAAAEGDRSENAEYIYGRKKMREIDGRLRRLARLLDNARVVDIDRLSGDRVAFGATVLVEEEHGKRRRWTLVGEGEAFPREGTISVTSPVARALLGRTVGEVVDVDLPDGETELEILELDWGWPGLDSERTDA